MTEIMKRHRKIVHHLVSEYTGKYYGYLKFEGNKVTRYSRYDDIVVDEEDHQLTMSEIKKIIYDTEQAIAEDEYLAINDL